jgi:2-aminoadipate transaminase
VPIACDDDGPLPDDLLTLPQRAPGCRFAYLLPNFQNPTGRLMSEARRQAIVAAAQQIGLPLVEDNPYGELWYDAPPPAPLAARWPEGTVYLGSFSKVLAPGLRLGYLVAPPGLYERLLQAKQASDLHSSSLAQHLVLALLQRDVLTTQLPALRSRYRASRDAMQAALQRELPGGCRWATPQGGMFFWLTLPPGLDAQRLLEQALASSIAFVPGAEFYVTGTAGPAERRTLRLSFVTLSPAQIDEAVRRLGAVLRAALAADGRSMDTADADRTESRHATPELS